MTPQAIRDGFESLRSDQQMAGLASAARSRSEADWLVGINGTRAMTAFNSRDGGSSRPPWAGCRRPRCRWWWSAKKNPQVREPRLLGNPRHLWRPGGRIPRQVVRPQVEEGRGRGGQGRPRMVCRRGKAIANAVRGKQATVTEESKPTTQASPLLFDLTSLQREANGKFGFSAKTTLALAQSLYERHKALTYPRTDSRALPEDYLPVAKQTFEMLADSGMRHLAPHALTALNNNYIRPSKRIFDNSKVSDHFAIIPTTQAPSGLSEAEQKLYDLVVRRFMAVFFPSAEYTVTTRISTVAAAPGRPTRRGPLGGSEPHEVGAWGHIRAQLPQDRRQGAGQAGLAGHLRQGSGRRSRRRQGRRQGPEPGAGQTRRNGQHPAGRPQGPQDQAPARYSEATLLGAMESAGKQIDDDELRERHAGKRPGHASHARAIIEGLLTENTCCAKAARSSPRPRPSSS